MNNFRRQAEINVKVNATQAQRALMAWERNEKRRIREEIEGLRRVQRVSNRSYEERMQTRKQLSRLKKRLIDLDLRHETRVVREEKRLTQERIRLMRGVTRAMNIEAKRRKVIRVSEFRDAKRASRARAMAGGRGSGGLGTFAGLGPHGMSGGMYAGGMAGIAALGAFAAYGIGSRASQAGMEQEKSLASLMALVTSNERGAGFSLDYAREQAQELAITLGVTVPEAANAMREAITTAVDPFKSPEFVKQAQGLAVIEGADLGETTATLAAVRNAYEMTTLEMKTVADVIFTSIDEGRVKMDQIKGQLGDAAGIARAAGISFKELMAGHAALTRGGMSGARAMTSMRAFGEILLKPATARVTKARERAGLDLSVERMKAIGFLKVMQEIHDASERSGISIAKLLGGRVRALKGIIQLSGALHDDMSAIMDMQEKNIEAGRAEAARQEYLESSGQRMERLGNAFEAATGAFGQGLIEGFTEGMGSAEEFQARLETIVDLGKTTGERFKAIAEFTTKWVDKLWVSKNVLIGIRDILGYQNDELAERNRKMREADDKQAAVFEQWLKNQQAAKDAFDNAAAKWEQNWDKNADDKVEVEKERLKTIIGKVKIHYSNRLDELKKYLKAEESLLKQQEERRKTIRDAKMKARGASKLESAFTLYGDYEDAVQRGDMKTAMDIAKQFQGMDVKGLSQAPITGKDIRGAAGSTDPRAQHQAYMQLMAFQERMRQAASKGGREMSAADALGISMMEGAGGEGDAASQTRNIKTNIETIKKEMAQVEAHWGGTLQYVKYLEQSLEKMNSASMNRNSILGLLFNVRRDLDSIEEGTGVETMADGREMEYHKGGVKIVQNFFAPTDPGKAARSVQTATDRGTANPNSK